MRKAGAVALMAWTLAATTSMVVVLYFLITNSPTHLVEGSAVVMLGVLVSGAVPILLGVAICGAREIWCGGL